MTKLPMGEAYLYKLVGSYIRRARGKRFTQLQLAEATGLSRTSITNLESGNQKIPIHILFRIARALDVEPGNLIPELSEVFRPSRVENRKVGNKMASMTESVRALIEELDDENVADQERELARD